MATSDPEPDGGPGPEKTLRRPTRSLRCSDAERERASVVLHEAVGEGRLTLDEAEERLGEVYTARYGDELAALTADLPERAGPTGWGLVLALARRQLADDVAALTGRDDGMSRRQRLAAALAALAVVLFVMATVVFVLHGIVGDGFERAHGLD